MTEELSPAETELNRKREILLDYLKKNEEEQRLIKEKRKESHQTDSKKKEEEKTAQTSVALSLPPKPEQTVMTKTVVIDEKNVKGPEGAAGDGSMTELVSEQEDQGVFELENITKERMRLESLSNKRAILEQELARDQSADDDEVKLEKIAPAKESVSAVKSGLADEKEDSSRLALPPAQVAGPSVAATLDKVSQTESAATLELKHQSRQLQEVESHKKLAKIIEHRAARRALYRHKQKQFMEAANDFVDSAVARVMLPSKSKPEKKSKMAKTILTQLHWSFKQWLLAGTILALGFYLCFLIVVYTFAPNFFALRLLDQYLPVPAMLSSFGLVNYYDFLTLQKSTAGQALGNDAMYVALREQVMINLAKKYDVYSGLQTDLLTQVLERRVIEDFELNFYTANKYHQLKLAVRTSQTLAEIAQKTELKINNKKYSRKLLGELFGEQVANLPVGGLSGIILNDKGVWVISPVGEVNSQVEIEYVYVPARTLDQLITEQMNSSWIVSFVN